MAKASNTKKTQPHVRKANNNNAKSKKSNGGGAPKVPILLVLAQFKNMGTDKPSRKLLSQLSRYPEHSLSTTLLNIKKKDGHVDYDKDSAWLTETGWQAAQDKFGDQIISEGLMDNSATHESLKSMHNLTGSKLKIFDNLTDGSAKSYEELMELIGCTNPKSFGTYASALKSAGLAETVTENGTKKLQLVDTCFPFGRPTVA